MLGYPGPQPLGHPPPPTGPKCLKGGQGQDLSLRTPMPYAPCKGSLSGMRSTKDSLRSWVVRQSKAVVGSSPTAFNRRQLMCNQCRLAAA